jgi:quercetin dioxygenase-like cupin family protein
MNESRNEVILRRFESPDETRVMEKGKFEVVHIGGLTVGRATYQPGWRWSEHVGPTVGAKRCAVAHVGLVVSGTATAALEDGRVFELRAGELFYIPQVPHDSWVVGDSHMFPCTFKARTTTQSSRRRWRGW